MVDNVLNRRFLKEDISIQPWLPLKVDGKQYLLKSFFGTCETSYEVILYDGESMDMWVEMVNVERFEEKWKQSNSSIEANWSNLLGHVKASLEECRETSSIKITVENEETVNLVVKTKLKGKIPFTWRFVCSKCKQALVKNMLVSPLFDMVKELHREQQKLFSIIERKDREIEDYKDQGYSNSRSHLTTMPFRKSSFVSGCMIDQEFHSNCTLPSIATLTCPDISQLYRNVMINKQAHVNENMASTSMQSISILPTFDTASINSIDKIPNIPSWSGPARNPGSVVNDKMDDTLGIPTKTAAINQPALAQDEEKARREAIRKRLEEDERKNKTKKRKINI